jgi:PAS domain S-box-containing protein
MILLKYDIFNTKFLRYHILIMNELNKKLESIAIYTNTPIIVTDNRQKIEWVNKSFSNVSGYSLEECIGLVPGHFLQGEGTDKETINRIKKKIASKESFQEEILNYTKTGNPYWSRIIVDPILDSNNEVTNFIAVQQDITELKNKEQILLYSQEIAQVGSWLFDISTGKLSWSKELYKIFEVEDDVNEKDLFAQYLSRIHPEDTKELQNHVEHTIQHSTPYKFFHRIICPSGITKYIYCVGRPILSKNGEVIKLQGISQDITEQKSVEMEIYDSKRSAEEASRAKSSFLAMMSHEIRTPMNSILGMSQLLLQSNLDNEQKEMLSTIKTSSDNLLKIINDILDFSKIESGSIQLEEDVINIKSSIEDIISLFKPQCIEKKISIEYLNSSFDLPNILADETRLKQVLINIIGNSVKFTNNGKITISTKVLSRNDNNIDLQFRIKDTGIGMAEKDLDKLFKPFSQISNHSNKNTGTGLGLVITKKIIEMYSGEIGVSSVLHEGTEFYFNFKLKITDVSKDDLNNESLFILDKYLSEKIPLKILIADDNQMNQKVLTLFLNKMGYKPKLVENGLEVLEEMKINNYDVIFMDVQMPKMDGLETTKEIIRLYSDKRPKIVGVTANAFKEDKKLCYEAGMDSYLSKPINIDRIQDIIIKLFDKDK